MTHSGAAPKWEVIKDPTARSQPYVLAQLSADDGGNRFPLAVMNSPVFRNGEVSVRFKPVSGKEEQAAGLVWRYRDENNYYLARANALENNVAVFRVENGRYLPLSPRGMPHGFGVRHTVVPNQWAILKVAFKGPLFSVFYDHRRLFTVEDDTFDGSGRVGLWTKADSVTYFDDFRVVER